MSKRNPKFEIIVNARNPKQKFLFESFEHLYFGFVSNVDIKISNLSNL